MSNTYEKFLRAPLTPVETVQNGPKCTIKKKHGTKKCGTCLGYARNNKQINCHHCAKNGAIVSNWQKAEKKQSGLNIGKVCPRIGCNWSTKGNRTLFCGRCATPFPSATKRKSYKRKARVEQKMAKKQKTSNKTAFSPEPGLDLKIVTDDLMTKKYQKTSNKTAFSPEPGLDLKILTDESEGFILSDKQMDELMESVGEEWMTFDEMIIEQDVPPLSLNIFNLI